MSRSRPCLTPALLDYHMPISTEDTIVAIATPPGRGGVGIVRLSGPRSWPIGERIFRRANRKRAIISHHLYYGHAVDPVADVRLDEGLIAFMRGPRSYTGEDLVEINAHGAPLVLRRIVEAALAQGARSAEPGEMTLRAFLHERIDLAQAEAVADLIAADSDAAVRQALGQLAGHLSERVQSARTEVLRALAPIEASIDFPEEEVPAVQVQEIHAAVASAARTVSDLLAGAERGRIAREGVRCVIAGRPNVGKSSLLNALLRVDRAIVTPIAGTTRDTIEETAQIGGIACHLVDTAGITTSDDPVERAGVERSRAALASAELSLLVLDRSEPLAEADRAICAEIAALHGGRGLVVVLNKSDLPARIESDEVAAALAEAGIAMPEGLATPPTVAISVLTGAGLDMLEQAMVTLALGEARGESAGLVARARHRDALRQAIVALEAAQTTLATGMPLDFAAEDLREALNDLGAITGETITEHLLTTIFQEFCIGK
jgi:tRNA modification GTPase